MHMGEDSFSYIHQNLKFNEKLEEELKKHLSIVVDLNRSTRSIVQRSALKKSCAKHQLTFHDKNSS